MASSLKLLPPQLLHCHMWSLHWFFHLWPLGSELLFETEESCAVESDGLKEQVRVMFSKLANPVDQLEFVDLLQRLGVAAHFSLEINNFIENIHNNKDISKKKRNLHASALEFRILRQHGYDV